ncbi:scarecrow-like protein 32 isoform X2 [Malania oleifera]|uniref:scarecrow-like protein 32 isoform X2 n=1 Tax=Malania oleifera TaxID=397392 RepID=UPI0025AE9C89|nr:scarecrow-like protein 32 isoform X2 [Malania oleifera]
MEQLLLHCADAIESNDATLAQQILWVLNNIATPDGDSNQRLTCAFLRALVACAAQRGTCKMITAAMANAYTTFSFSPHRFSIIELAAYVDLTPWHRFGFTAANAAILNAVEGFSAVHIIDLSSTHCMQIPTLIDAIANRPEGPPLIRLTVAGVAGAAGADEAVPPLLDLSYEELGSRLVNFARSRNVTMEFQVIPSSSSNGFSSLIDHLRIEHLVYDDNEALVINCHMMLHCIPEQINISPNLCPPPPSSPPRTVFLEGVRSLEPRIMVVVDEDVDFTSNNLMGRLRAAYNYMWIPYDTVETFPGRGRKQRQWYEADVGWKIENVVAQGGWRRVERQEPRQRWVERMTGAGFGSLGFGEEGVSEVKSMLDEHAAGWGLKKEEDDLVLTWKGHNVVFATAWVPA